MPQKPIAIWAWPHNQVQRSPLLAQDKATPAYRDLGRYEVTKDIWQQLLTAYNQQRKGANLVFFVDALDHLIRLHRVLSLPQVGF